MSAIYKMDYSALEREKFTHKEVANQSLLFVIDLNE